MKKIIAILLALVMALSLAACGATAPADDTTPAATGSTEPAGAAPTVVGEGQNVFSFTVVDLEGQETAYEIHTDETTVGAALLALGLIEGEDGQYGLYVTAVNGIVADYQVDRTYWGFYVDGEYALTGVDSTEIVADSVYSFVRTQG